MAARRLSLRSVSGPVVAHAPSILVGAGCLWLAFLLSSTWLMALQEPFSIEYEGHVLWAVGQLRAGANLYDVSRLSSEPLAVVIYNPFYFLVGAGLASVFGQGFLTLRLVSIVSAAACALSLYLIARQDACRRVVAVLGAAYFLSFMPVAYWSCLARVDLLGLALAAFSMQGFLAAFKRQPAGSSRLRPYVLPLGLFLLSFFTKQQYFVFGLSFVIFLLWMRRYCLAAKMFFAGLAGVCVLALFMERLTGGYLAHLTFAAGLPWELKTLSYHLELIARDPKTCAGLLVLLAGMLAGGRIASVERLACVLMLTSLVISCYTMGLRGAYHNHLLTSIFGFSLWVALMLGRLRSWLIAPVALVVLAGLPGPAVVTARVESARRSHAKTECWLATAKTPLLEAGRVLSEDPSLAMLLGAEPAIVDATTFMNVWRNHPSRLEPLVNNILGQRYALIIINEYDSKSGGVSIWPPEVVQAIRSRYRQAGRVRGNGNMQDVFLPDRRGAGEDSG